MQKTFILITLSIFSFSCIKGKKVDVVFHNASIHLLDDNQNIQEAMAVKNGRIIETGPERQILNKYSANETIDLQQSNIYPGLICPFVPYNQLLIQLQSTNIKSEQTENSIVTLIEKHFSATPEPRNFISLNIPVKFQDKTLKFYQIITEKYKNKNFIFYSKKNKILVFKLRNETFKELKISENTIHNWISKTIQFEINSKQKYIDQLLTAYLENGYTTLDIPVFNQKDIEIIEKISEIKKITIHYYLTEDLIRNTKKITKKKCAGLIIDTMADLLQQISFAKAKRLNILFPSNLNTKNQSIIQSQISDYTKDHRWKIIINTPPTNEELEFYTINNFSIVFNSELKYNLPNELTYFTIQNKSSDPTNISTLLKEQKLITTDLLNTVLFSQTKWASYQNFEELNLGTLEKNKWATFIVMNSKINNSSTNFPIQIYSKGKIIYNAY